MTTGYRYERAEQEIGGPFQRPRSESDPFNVEICLVYRDSESAYQRARR